MPAGETLPFCFLSALLSTGAAAILPCPLLALQLEPQLVLRANQAGETPAEYCLGKNKRSKRQLEASPRVHGASLPCPGRSKRSNQLTA